MKKTDKLKQRPWRHPNYPWRAVDKNGGDYYYLYRPEKYDKYEWGISSEQPDTESKWPVRFVGTIQLEFAEDWENTVQSYDDYLKISNQQP